MEVKTEADEEAGTRHQKFAPLRVKIEPKIEADLHDTYGVTGINHYSPVKEEVKEEEVVDDEIVEDVDDDAEEREAKLKKDLAIKKRVETIRRKFQKIGERERKNKLIKTQKQALEEARKKTRETLPTKTARKAPQKPGPKSKQKPVDVSDEEPEKVTSEKCKPRHLALIDIINIHRKTKRMSHHRQESLGKKLLIMQVERQRVKILILMTLMKLITTLRM